MFKIDRADNCIWVQDQRPREEGDNSPGFHVTPRQALDLAQQLIGVAKTTAQEVIDDPARTT